MTISLARRQKLAAIAKAHDEWVDANLASVSSVFDPAAHPKEDSDYNQHNLDVDASGAAEDDLAARAAAIFGAPMTAAGDPDWDPKEHPRGPDGKFIEDGFADSLKKKIKETSTAKNVAYLKDEMYKAQALHEELLGLEKQLADFEASTKGGQKALKPGDIWASTIPKSETLTGKDKTTVVFPDDADGNEVTGYISHENGKVLLRNLVTDEVMFTGTSVSNVLDKVSAKYGIPIQNQHDSGKITTHGKLAAPAASKVEMPPAAGKSITAWTKTIYSGKYADGEVVAYKDDGSARLVWDAEDKKFLWQTQSLHAKSSGWMLKEKLTKKAAYENFKGDKKSWFAPVAGTSVVDSAPPPVFAAPAPVSKSAIESGDFSGLKKVGPQGGSNPGGVYEAPDGSRWYVKSQKSEAHARNEALAAAFYRMAGIDVPEVIQGKDTPGLGGSTHTASRMVPGAKEPFPKALSDKSDLAEIRKGFALDAWLANWDVAGLSYDNVVKGSDGKLYRIDVGGALLFRAMGGPKGSAFGDQVTEFETLRDGTNYVSQSIFGSMSAQEIAASAKRVQAISPDQIRKLVADYGMDPELADRLIARREDILSRAGVKSAAKVTSPDFTILPASQRGKSGDGHFAPKIWGRYGAAGVMMRHVDENGVARFLLVKANTTNSKRWQLPGGALEELETPEQGAAREVHEELGFTQDFLHGMTPIGTHKVTIDVPDKGQWSYSNIAVDVPNAPELTWDEGELGGAQWFTAQQLAAMSADDEIHPALKSNLDQILGKFTGVKSSPPASAPDVSAPAPAPAPAISPSSTDATTTWTKKKFTQTLAYKKDYEPREVVGIADTGGFHPSRVLWENGKFHWQNWDPNLNTWVFGGTWGTKKSVLDSLQGQSFYIPPKSTVADINNDYFTNADIGSGSASLKTQGANPDIFQEQMDAGPVKTQPGTLSSKVATAPWGGGDKPFGDYITSLTVNSVINPKAHEHIGAIHERKDGGWVTEAKAGVKTYLPSTPFYSETKEQGLAALAQAYDDYLAVQARKTPVPPPSKAKKLPKVTAAQIEKQNGTVPKSLKQAQRTKFLQNLKENSPMGNVQSSEEDAKKVFAALVFAVQKHNESNSPKINYLQGLNLLDQVYGSKQKSKVVAWLGTAEGKTTAPLIVGGGGYGIPGSDAAKVSDSGTVTGIKVSAKLATVSSPYTLGKPKKVSPNEFRTFSLSDAIDMHQEMEQARPLTPVQRKVVEKYTNSATPFNDPLRGNGEDSLWNPWDAQDIADLQSAMRPVTQSFTVTRSTGGLGEALNNSTSAADVKKLEGAVISDPAFLSTSIPGGKFSSDRFQLVISVPEGTPAVWAHHFSYHESEREVLLAAGLHYRIDSIDPPTASGWDRRVYLTVVPEKVKK